MGANVVISYSINGMTNLLVVSGQNGKVKVNIPKAATLTITATLCGFEPTYKAPFLVISTYVDIVMNKTDCTVPNFIFVINLKRRFCTNKVL